MLGEASQLRHEYMKCLADVGAQCQLNRAVGAAGLVLPDVQFVPRALCLDPIGSQGLFVPHVGEVAAQGVLAIE